jgi:hypothetical protein
MPRPLTGRIVERRLHDERLAYDVVIRRRQVLVGYAPEWTRRRVELLLTDVLIPRAALREPWWDEIPTPDDEDGQAVGDGVATVREVASEYVERLQSQYSNTATLNAYMSPVMKHVGPFFAYDGERERRVDEITGGLVSHFTATKMAERELLTNLAATLAELDDNDLRDPARLRGLLDSEAEWDLLVRFGQRRGRLPLSQALGARDAGRISLSSRGLSNNEINRCLARLRDILELARDEPQLAGQCSTTASTNAASSSRRPLPSWPGWPPGLRPDGSLPRLAGALGGSALGGCDELRELRFSRRSSCAIRSSCCATRFSSRWICSSIRNSTATTTSLPWS